MSEKRKDILAVACLLVVIVIRFSPFLFLGKPLNTDSWSCYYPWAVNYDINEQKTINYDSNMEYGSWFPLVKKELSEGQFPLWDPNSMSGMPLYVDKLIPIFHVPFALSMLWPGDLVMAAYVFLMCIIGTLFFYWFLRNWKFSVFVSLFGGLAFFLSGWQMYLYPPEVASLIWIPAILLFHDRFLESNRISDACWAAFFTGQLLIGGYPVMIAHFFYVIAVYMLWRRFHPDFKWKTPVNRWVYAVLIIGILGTLISTVQLYPTYKYMKLSNRDIASEQKMFLSPEQLMQKKMSEVSQASGQKEKPGLVDLLLHQLKKKSMVIVPTYKLDLNESRNYAGPVIIYLGLIGLFTASKRFKAIKILFLIFGIFFVIPPIFSLIAKFIPGWSISALLPAEVFFFLLFFMAVLGLDFVVKNEKKSIPLFVYSLIFLYIIGYFWILQEQFSRSHPTYEGMDYDDWYVAIETGFYFFPILIIAERALRGKLTDSYQFAIAFFVISGLLAHFYLYPYFADKELMPYNDDMKAIVAKCQDGRIVRYAEDEPRLDFTNRLEYILPPNTPTRYGLMDSLGYDNMIPAYVEKFFNEAAPGSLIRSRGTFHIRGKESLNPKGLFVQASAVRYVMEKASGPDRYSTSYPSVEIGGIRIYDLYNQPVQLYAKVFTNYELESEYKGDPRTDDFTQKIILEKKPVFNGNELQPSAGSQPANYVISNFLRTKMTLDVDFETAQDGILYIADTYHPYWKAELDGKPVEIIKANYAFRAIAVPKGKHSVSMTYNLSEIVNSGYVSLASLILLIVLGFTGHRKPKEKGTEHAFTIE